MALLVKQDFTPPILSRKWIAFKFRPNMLLICRPTIIAILESGAMFREDSVTVEELMPTSEATWLSAGGGSTGWFTSGEQIMAISTLIFLIAVAPPGMRNSWRSNTGRVVSYAGVSVVGRILHRVWLKRHLTKASRDLLQLTKDYTSLLRRTMACLKEYKLLGKGLESVWTVVKSTRDLICEQQSQLSLLLCRCSSSLLGNLPWLQEDVSWSVVDAIPESIKALGTVSEADLVKIHHTFLVIQSSFLKHLAMSHFVQMPRTAKLYKNHNERLYWLHTQLLPHLCGQYKDNFDSLDRMYRLLRNCSTTEVGNRRTGLKLKEAWLYSDIHCGVTRATIELKTLLNRATNLDIFLDNYSNSNRTELDPNVLYKDIDVMIDDITRCLSNLQSTQLRLKKITNKHTEADKESINLNITESPEKGLIKIGDTPLRIKDEVFYFHKSADESERSEEPTADLITEPGDREKLVSKMLLTELKRNLVKRESVMREREKLALAFTMPELKGNLPEFPRHTPLDPVLKGYINKLKSIKLKKNNRKNCKRSKFTKKIDKRIGRLVPDDASQFFSYNVACKVLGNSSISIVKSGNVAVLCDSLHKTLQLATASRSITKSSEGVNSGNEANDVLYRNDNTVDRYLTQNGAEDRLKVGTSAEGNVASAVEVISAKQNGVRYNDSFNSDSSTDSEFNSVERKEMLDDLRRYRASRKKTQRGTNTSYGGDADEGLLPMEYSFGANAAMASVLQSVRQQMAEEVFAADGELSEDSGNEDER